MKKGISVFLLFVMILWTSSIYAADRMNVLDSIFQNESLSGEVEFEMIVKPNKPLPNILDPYGDLTAILEGMNYTYHIKYIVSEDNNKAQFEINAKPTQPTKLYKEMQFWIDFDMSDINNPVNKIITKSQEEDKYMYIDYAADSHGGDISEVIHTVRIIEPKLSEIINRYNFKTENQNGTYITRIDEDTIKDLSKDFVLSMAEHYIEYFIGTSFKTDDAASVGIIGGADGPTVIYTTTQEEKEYEKAIDDFFAKLNSIQIFDKDGVVVETKLNDKEEIESQSVSAHVNTNLAELMAVFDESDPMITKENSNIDITLKVNITCDKLNEKVSITFPKLNENNSINLLEKANESTAHSSPRKNSIMIMAPENFDTLKMKVLDDTLITAADSGRITLVPDESYKEKVMVMIAAGESCTFFVSDRDKEMIELLIEHNTLIPVEEYIEKYAPDIQKFLNENPGYKESITNKDGHIYMIPTFYDNQKNLEGFLINYTVYDVQKTVEFLDEVFLRYQQEKSTL